MLVVDKLDCCQLIDGAHVQPGGVCCPSMPAPRPLAGPAAPTPAGGLPTPPMGDAAAPSTGQLAGGQGQQEELQQGWEEQPGAAADKLETPGAAADELEAPGAKRQRQA